MVCKPGPYDDSGDDADNCHQYRRIFGLGADILVEKYDPAGRGKKNPADNIDFEQRDVFQGYGDQRTEQGEHQGEKLSKSDFHAFLLDFSRHLTMAPDRHKSYDTDKGIRHGHDGDGNHRDGKGNF